MDDVAIMLSTYNGEKYLDEQLHSIWLQKDVQVHLYVRDDGSTDSTLSIIDRWKEKLCIESIPFDCNVGPAYSFWKLCKAVPMHAYYAFCDQDDVWDEDKLITAIRQINMAQGPALCFCDERTIDANGKVLLEETIPKPIVTFESEIVCGYCPGCAMVFNYALLAKVIKHEYTAICMHDMLFLLNAYILGEVVFDPIPHFSRRVHANNVVATDGRRTMSKIKYKIKRYTLKSRVGLDSFVQEIVKNNTFDQKKEYGDELLLIANYKHHIGNIIKILRNRRFTSANSKGLRSFRIRLIWGLL